jgi:hypothetical protein
LTSLSMDGARAPGSALGASPGVGAQGYTAPKKTRALKGRWTGRARRGRSGAGLAATDSARGRAPPEAGRPRLPSDRPAAGLM